MVVQIKARPARRVHDVRKCGRNAEMRDQTPLKNYLPAFGRLAPYLERA